MKFFLLFSSTPFSSTIPLKALTSQGMRFDVACRMLRACVLGPDGLPSGHSVSAWFAMYGKHERAIELVIDGHVLMRSATIDHFRSELVLAKHLKAIATGLVPGSVKNENGIRVTILDEGINIQDAFLESIRREKEVRGTNIILFHEHGKPIFYHSRPGMLEWKQEQELDAAVVIGDHNGFPMQVEQALLRMSDNIFSIACEQPANEIMGISYLGSHVAAIVKLFSVRETLVGKENMV